MSKIEVHAHQVRKGDEINIGGHVVKLAAKAFYAPFLEPAPTMDPDLFYFAVDRDALVTVERPDPDAELIEVMTKAAYEEFSRLRWGDAADFTRNAWRGSQRAALAAAREAGLLPKAGQ